MRKKTKKKVSFSKKQRKQSFSKKQRRQRKQKKNLTKKMRGGVKLRRLNPLTWLAEQPRDYFGVAAEAKAAEDARQKQLEEAAARNDERENNMHKLAAQENAARAAREAAGANISNTKKLIGSLESPSVMRS